MSIFVKTILSAAGVATVLTTALPLSAADMGAPVSVSGQRGVILDQAANDHRRGWGRRHDDIDGGDILTGIGILAGIAILADAVSSSSKGQNRRRQEDRPVYRDSAPERYENGPSANSGGGYSGDDLGTAVTACNDAAERSAGGSARVQEIRSVTRDGNGWRVAGDLDRGSNRGFTCNATDGWVDNIQLDDGRI
jgi:hypothetical protein